MHIYSLYCLYVQDISTSFDNSEDKRQRLQSRERQLSRVIQAEDMNVLHQRIRLLNKQWDELRSQATLRDHRLQVGCSSINVLNHGSKDSVKFD